MRRFMIAVGVVFLLALASIGWGVLLAQNPVILAKARWRYQRAVWQKVDLSSGPCLGEIAPDWVLDIAHLPRQERDNLPENQCEEFRNGSVHHFVEMTPQGEVIVVQ